MKRFSVVLLLTALGFAYSLGYAPILAQTTAQTNFTDSCVTNYDPSVDYFPVESTFTAAQNVSIAYFNHYKVVSVFDAFDDAPTFSYVLVQCGTPAPAADEFPEGTQFIDVPAPSMIAMSTTYLPHLVALNRVDQLVGLDSFLYVNAPEVRERIDAGALIEVGSGTDINVEAVIDSEAGFVMTGGFNPATDAHPVLIDAGVFTALNAEWREATPLGRAEWIKYTGLFFNAEAEANAAYNAISTAYDQAVELTASVPEAERPVVLWNSFSPYSNSWIIPGAETFVGRLIQDAGGVIALGDQAPTGSASLSLEVVYDQALDADVWVANAFAIAGLDDLIAQDSRYLDFSAVSAGEVWNDDADVNENGGSNYWELGVTNPHLILQDLIAIFHPSLLPEHEFRFYRRLS
ncbi:MAG: ABC transporter substrate-binding protein [bacterium]|nr:ABC transporter substrate-binding protein [bacterium]